jgi:CHAD domain-containing protein
VAFRLTTASAIDDQLAQIVARELRKATEAVDRSGDEESIHQARKHIKKARSVLHLLRKPLGRDYDTLNDPIRLAAHRISAVRDADALVGTLTSLRARYHDVIGPLACRKASATLKARRRQAYARISGRPFAGARQILVKTQRGITSRVHDAATARRMRLGVTRGYRRARRAMAEAITAGADDALFHAWRRRVKDHLYQMRLLERLDRHAAARIRPLDQLQDWLGDDHNLVLLRTAMLAQPERFGDARGVAAILGCIDKRLSTLRRRSVRRGRRLFARKPSSFQKEMRSAWGGGYR